MTNETLIAVPVFVFMGVMLERSKLAEQLLQALAQLMRRIPGGLGLAVMLVGALMAASTGLSQRKNCNTVAFMAMSVWSICAMISSGTSS